MWHVTLGSCAWPPPCSSASPDSTAPCYEHTAPAEAAKGACAAASRQRAVSAGTGAALGALCLAACIWLGLLLIKAYLEQEGAWPCLRCHSTS